MDQRLPFVIVVSFVATLVRSTFGFGESLVAVPLLAMLVPITVAVPLSVLMSILVAGIVVVRDRASIDFASAKWLVAFAVLGIPLGLAVLAYANAHWVKIALGALIVGYGVYSLFQRRVRSLKLDSRLWLFVCGFASGVLGGAYGLNGPPLVAYGHLRGWSAQEFRATLQAYFLPASILGMVGYAAKGLVDWSVLRSFAFCVPAIVPAVLLGRYFNARLKGAAFFRYLYLGLIAIGAALIMVSARD
jgi:uncharacterized membrane protein YfcA